MQKLLFNEKVIYINGNRSDNRSCNIIKYRGYKNNSKSISNGYISIYFPEHPNASESNGRIYEHVLVAENKLGRLLNAGECVHHIDRNRMNNDPYNLMVFKTNKDHVLYHYGASAWMQNDGSYICTNDTRKKYSYIYNNVSRENAFQINDTIIKANKYKTICPICKTNTKDYKANMCRCCYNKKISSNIIDRDLLKSYIRSMPFTKIGTMFNVSGNAIRRWCDKYNLPRRTKDILSYSDEEWELI